MSLADFHKCAAWTDAHGYDEKAVESVAAGMVRSGSYRPTRDKSMNPETN